MTLFNEGKILMIAPVTTVILIIISEDSLLLNKIYIKIDNVKIYIPSKKSFVIFYKT